jgi:hypothetical protein
MNNIVVVFQKDYVTWLDTAEELADVDSVCYGLRLANDFLDGEDRLRVYIWPQNRDKILDEAEALTDWVQRDSLLNSLLGYDEDHEQV